MSAAEDKIEIANINTPGRTTRVNRAKYEAMRAALLTVLPDAHRGRVSQMPKLPCSRCCRMPCFPKARPLDGG